MKVYLLDEYTTFVSIEENDLFEKYSNNDNTSKWKKIFIT
jgi:hypothetical protein